MKHLSWCLVTVDQNVIFKLFFVQELKYRVRQKNLTIFKLQ